MEETTPFSEAVRLAHEACLQRIYSDPGSHKGEANPLLSDISEEIALTCKGYADTDLSSIERYDAWCSEVAQELNRQGLAFQLEPEERSI